MENQAAVVIAQVLGPFYLVAGIALLLDPGRFAAVVDAMAASAAQTFVWSFVVLTCGLVVLAFHSGWRGDWTVVVTLIGWLATLKGALLMTVPDRLMRVSRGIAASPNRLRLWAAVPLALGVFLAAMGFGRA